MTEACGHMPLLIQAELDGELDAAEAAELRTHLAGCAACREQAAALHALSSGLRALPVGTAPASLRASVIGRLGLASPRPAAPNPARSRFGLRPAMLGFGAGVAAAAMIALLIPGSRSGPVEALVAGHIRALQPGHLTDVLSSDRHTVKPWFDGRIDYAPPVRDLAAAGFALIGGRLDYLAQRPVAAMAYRHAQHIIDLYVWPGPPPAAAAGSRQGYNWRAWEADGMSLWAVSDIEPADLAAFEHAWRDAR